MMRRLLHDEDGQSLLYGAGAVVITLALFYGAIDIGMLVLGKIQAQGAVDAAALSAASLKTGVHNTRALAYRAASGQLALTRMQLLQATGYALEGLYAPGTDNRKKFDEALGLALFHRENVEALSEGVEKFNAFVADRTHGEAAVKEAARIAYLGNIGVLGVSVPANLDLIKHPDALEELSGTPAIIGGTAFGEEGIGGTAGKSHVVVEPRVNAVGSGLLGYGKQALLSAAATAGPVDAQDAFGKNLPALDPLRGYGTHWYTTRLEAIGEGGRK